MPKVQDIAPAKYNPRKISKVHLEALGRSMREFGDLGGLVIIARWEKASGEKAVKL